MPICVVSLTIRVTTAQARSRQPFELVVVSEFCRALFAASKPRVSPQRATKIATTVPRVPPSFDGPALKRSETLLCAIADSSWYWGLSERFAGNLLNGLDWNTSARL